MGKKSKDRNERILTYFSEKLATYEELKKYIGKPIYQALSFLTHQEKHRKHYVSVEAYYHCLEHIKDIIDSYDQSLYEARRKGIIIFKEFKDVNQIVKLVININDRDELFVATIFPTIPEKINYLENKIEKDNQQYYIEKHTYKK